MKKQLYIVYETDAWHTVSSRTLMGIFSSKRTAINSIVKYHDNSLKDILSDVDTHGMTIKQMKREAGQILRKELEAINQTQGYSVNYVIEICSQNEWLCNL